MAGGFREALLKQDGIEPGALPAFEREKVRRLLARDRAGIRWLKRGTALSWILAILVCLPGVSAYFLASQGPNPALTPEAQAAQTGISKLFVLRIIMPIEAAAASLWLYLRTRTVNRTQLRAALAACETELTEYRTKSADFRTQNAERRKKNVE